MYYQIKSYVKYLRKATNQHGVHSPFIYDLVTQCFYNKKKYSAYETLTKHRKHLLKDMSNIVVTDFGAGSRVFTSNKRNVAAIAKNAGMSKKRQRLLYRLVVYLQPKSALELGTSLGLGTVAMALGNPKITITTVEGCTNTANKAQDGFEEFSISNIELHNETFEDFFGNSRELGCNLVYIDGNHNQERTLSYFESLLPQVQNDSVLIFDDIYWSPQMTEAWNRIKDHKRVTASIDTYQWGLVFFRKEQQKQHFFIRL